MSDGSETRGEDSAPIRYDRTLRRKYHDYCSARLSEVFLSLSDDQIYDLMEDAAAAKGLNPADLDFERMMELATRRLRKVVPLPDYESWAEEYRENPERFEPFLLGFDREGAAEHEED